MCRINPSDTPHNTGSLDSFDNAHSPHSFDNAHSPHTDYEDIMQYRDMKSKPLDQLRKKFHVSTSCLYQIWRGQEIGRVEWNYSAVLLFYLNTNYIDKQNRTDLESDPVSEESTNSRAKKTGGKKRSQGDYLKSASISEPNIT
ncbi:18086_t:CDS:2 [Dentiscutata erythropus]|uniref:18086_t:CDS:1 n=1 Tax=Dentiscutata erythropus TaxID=1348616 RepID=A0A9N9JJP9_9GLOM|nr:18086_t:CDS:2 [Dentiscutata erythropus]